MCVLKHVWVCAAMTGARAGAEAGVRYAMSVLASVTSLPHDVAAIQKGAMEAGAAAGTHARSHVI
jgi:hypothetical protein